MGSIQVELRNVAGTAAALGWAGAHTIVVDRPAGKAGGMGLGFNGAELLGLAIGGCLCNDLRYVADVEGIGIGAIAVTVTLALEGTPLRAVAATVELHCETLDGVDPSAIIDKAKTITMVGNSLAQGFPVTIETR